MKRALIFGITGQDGAYLAKFLVDKGYKVFGGYRRASTRNFWRLHYIDVKKDIELLPIDLLDQTSILQAIQKTEPDEIYNLAAQSYVGASFDEAIATGEITGLGVTRILDSIHLLNPQIKFYQASTSEMYGNAPAPQNELTPFAPASPYAAAKLYAHWVTKNYREGYHLFTASGILFNHESPIRGIEFVSKKISDGVARIKLGLIDKLHLGNLEAKRDWGFAGDYVEAMWLMLQHHTPDDFVVATGISHSVREFCQQAFAQAGLDYEKYVVSDPRLFRPVDINHLQGDSSKAQKILGWQPKTSFTDLVRMMVENDMEKYRDPMRFAHHFMKNI